MNTLALKAMLQRLHQELESGEPVDPELRHLLRMLDKDIQRALLRDTQPLSSDEPPLNERAQLIEARFSSDHPYLANTLRDVMDTLGKMGI